eukprot:GHRQ01015587.1.p2 GENE.GHRQ01015587.1~~GHRQ01015587.1.p2  ORF type:complete len:118 (+),score=16.64 GHRQ01015587.1:934-1287(+)
MPKRIIVHCHICSYRLLRSYANQPCMVQAVHAFILEPHALPCAVTRRPPDCAPTWPLSRQRGLCCFRCPVLESHSASSPLTTPASRAVCACTVTACPLRIGSDTCSTNTCTVNFTAR